MEILLRRTNDNAPWGGRGHVHTEAIILAVRHHPWMRKKCLLDIAVAGGGERRKKKGSPPPDLSELAEQLSELSKSVKRKEDAQERTTQLIEWGAGLITLAGVATIFLVLLQSFFDAKNQRRSQSRLDEQGKQQDRVNDQLLTILKISEDVAKTSQNQVGQIYGAAYDQAQRTLALINDLLAVTERSARKAAGAQEAFLRRQIQRLQEKCVLLLNKAGSEPEDRAIAAKPEYQAAVRVAGEEFDAIKSHVDTYNSSVPMSSGAGEEGRMAPVGVLIPAHCLFVKGMHHHLNENYEEAIAQWQDALSARQAERIEAEINYWIGYENNNLGRFGDAEPYINAAVAIATGDRRAELERLALETRLFQIGDGPIDDRFIEEALKSYGRNEVAATRKRTISSFATTLANMLSIKQLRVASIDLGRAHNYLARAIEAEPHSRWADFAQLQCKEIAGSGFDAADKATISYVIDSCQREFRNRKEHRTKVLCKLTEYICIRWLGDEGNTERARDQIETHYGEVNGTMTILSQLQKRNLNKELFWSEFETLAKSESPAKAMKACNCVRAV